MSDLELREATPGERPLLAALAELYQYDFTEFTGEDVDSDGRYGAQWLHDYWSDPARTPFVARVGGAPAGFALVSRRRSLEGARDLMDVNEFFVMRKYRRGNVGERMARELFDRFAGPWQVRVMASNLPAQAFWRAIIGRYAGGKYDEAAWDDEHWRGPVLYVASARREG
jgi:predicted acetyltransferase